MSHASLSAPKVLVLVVDGEPLLRMIAIDLVEEAGCQAIEAADVDQAAKILESRNDIHISFTDIDMPSGSMNGLPQAAAVSRRWPPIKIIIVSGHYHVNPREQPSGSAFFEKPFKNDDLIRRLGAFASTA